MAPTRELVQQIAIEAKKVASVVGARVLGIYGGVGKGATVRAYRNADVFSWWFDGLLKTSLPITSFFLRTGNLVHEGVFSFG